MSEVRAEVALDLTLNEQEPSSTTDPYETTFMDWFNHLGRTIYIFETILERKKNRLHRLSLATTFFNAVTTLIVVSQFGVDQCEYSSALIALQAVLVAFSLCSTILSGIINVYGLNETVNNIQRFLDSAGALFALLSTEQMLPKESQANRKEFVLANKSRYIEILQTAPDINTSEYLSALAAYENSKKRFRGLSLPNFHK